MHATEIFIKIHKYFYKFYLILCSVSYVKSNKSNSNWFINKLKNM